jgi:hypothetical protein
VPRDTFRAGETSRNLPKCRTLQDGSFEPRVLVETPCRRSMSDVSSMPNVAVPNRDAFVRVILPLPRPSTLEVGD